MPVRRVNSLARLQHFAVASGNCTPHIGSCKTPQPKDIRIVCLRCADVLLCERGWSAWSAAVPTSESSCCGSIIVIYLFLFLRNVADLKKYKFLVNDLRLHVVCRMYPPSSDPGAYDRHDSHGRSVPDAGTFAIVTVILQRKNGKYLVGIH
jgi:hypothetical protein